MTSTFIHPSVTVCEHPLLQHNLSIVRDKHSQNETFRVAIQRVARFVLHEATKDLTLTNTSIETPIAKTTSQILSPHIPIIVSPILRAGLMMSDVMLDFIPTAHIYYIGLYRDEKTLKPVTYYNKLSKEIDYSNARIFILDPMLATGGSITEVLTIMRNLGVKETNITIACILAVPEGINALTDHFPKIKIFTGAIDKCLNEHAYIVPGLGDAGDRAFRTI